MADAILSAEPISTTGTKETEQHRLLRVSEVQRDIELVRVKRREILTGGVDVSIHGGFAVKNSTLEQLAQEESRLRRELFTLNGGVTRSAPDFRSSNLY